MRARNALLTVAATVVLGLGLAGCGGGADPEPTESTPTATPEPATEVIEVAPFTEDGTTADGWSVDDSTLAGGYAIPADTCRASEHGAGENTIACGSTADALSACWLTEQRDRIACLDEAEPEATTLRMIQLDGTAPAPTEASDEPDPLWLELEDGSMFVAVNGGAFTPPDGYLVAYTRLDGDGERFEELLVPDDDSAPIIDRGEDLWTVAVGADGEGAESVTTKRVTRAWVLAGRSLPEPEASGPETANGRWCEAPQSHEAYGCVTIAYPDFTIEETGETWPFTGFSAEGDGTIALSAEGAPFGTYYPAGTPIPAESLMGTADAPEQERIWSSQSGMMLFRE
ncbi:hypothetical protein [Leucobacter tenebrionis]|uniref:hypothetical protein n=1 Tax=Leucobacter tenebrionis TaxID=2873270 RepID=UPI001CA67C33|nr:hypothetical protein [Leucobacter tenebrionis]QZY51222.1 hypothetical protein KVY00_11515 [Leucobacter tenebrionis]